MSSKEKNILYRIKKFFLNFDNDDFSSLIVSGIIVLGIPLASIYAYLNEKVEIRLLGIIGLTFCSFGILFFINLGIAWLIPRIFIKDKNMRKEKQDHLGGIGCVPILLITLCIPFLLDNYINNGTIVPWDLSFFNENNNSTVQKNQFQDDGKNNYNLDDSYLEDNANVWITFGGNCYHKNSECISLKRSSSIKSTTKEIARNDGLLPCHICTAK